MNENNVPTINNEKKHSKDVQFTNESLIKFIEKIHQNIRDNYDFVSTVSMMAKENNFTDDEKEIINVFGDEWRTTYAGKICIINKEYKNKTKNSERYTWIIAGNSLKFKEELSNKGENDRPCGTFYIEENNGMTPHVIQIKGFKDGNFDNSTAGTVSNITTDIVYADSLGTNNSHIPEGYIDNLHVKSLDIKDPLSGLRSTGNLIITSTQEAKRNPNSPNVNKIVSDINNLQGSIRTLGGIAAGKSIMGYRVHGAVFNDYAEYRHTEQIQPGRCVIETGKGDLVLSDKRLQLGANIISDTFGFSIGKTQYANTPIAVCGRVLAYTYECRELFKPGQAVCSGPNGTISRMTRDEIRCWPDAIVGYVSEIPDYDEWGSDNIKVDGRIWIKVH